MKENPFIDPDYKRCLCDYLRYNTGKKPLVLTIKKRWFDMKVSGIKLEEYREHKPYYERLFAKYRDGERINIVYRNGYSANSPYISETDILHWHGTGHEEWGAVPGVDYFVLELLEALSTVWFVTDVIKGRCSVLEDLPSILLREIWRVKKQNKIVERIKISPDAYEHIEKENYEMCAPGDPYGKLTIDGYPVVVDSAVRTSFEIVTH